MMGPAIVGRAVEDTGRRSLPELFIYYRVAEADEADLRTAAAHMQAGLLAAHPGLQARLLRRPEASAGLLTFMEVYVLPASGVPGAAADAELRQAIEAAALGALAQWLKSERHVEVFLPCA